MARKLTKRELKALVQEIRRCDLSTFDIYLFGSAAKGLATKHSDRDFCIVVPDNTPNTDQHWHTLMRNLCPKGFDFDILIVTKSEFEKNKISPILHEIRMHGINVYSTNGSAEA